FAKYDVKHIDHILTNSEPVAMFIEGEERLARVETCPARSHIKTIVTSHESQYTRFEDCTAGGSSELFFHMVKDVSPDDVCFIQYTSGTTGMPKGVMLTHRNILSQQKALDKVWEISKQSRFLAYLPWHHSFGGLFERFSALCNGATLYLDDALGKDVERLVTNWSLAKPTQFFSVPKVFMALVTEARLNDEIKEILFHPELKFVFTAAAPLPKDCGEYFDSHNVHVLEGWGLTETSPCVTMTSPNRKRISSYVGEPIPGCEILITEESEILVKGPNIMKGYHKKPEKTEQAIDHYGWLHTGDMGELTDYGLKLNARRDGLFKLSNGERVSSQAVENALTAKSHMVSQAVAVGRGENYVAALLFPNLRNLKKWTTDNNKTQGLEWEIAEDKELQEMFHREIEDDMKNFQPHYARVKAYVIVPEELTIENGCLTPSMKMIRHHVIKKYGEWIDACFRPSKHPDKINYIFGDVEPLLKVKKLG
ncbi:MAG: long-chain fatty acid--CoA ligase, partial [bacterium]|nr:long-chain fatty acid--CoA ligase [bacterium]